MGERVYVVVEQRRLHVPLCMFKQLYYLSRHLYVTDETEISKIAMQAVQICATIPARIRSNKCVALLKVCFLVVKKRVCFFLPRVPMVEGNIIHFSHMNSNLYKKKNF